jgi:hypothetical protein
MGFDAYPFDSVHPEIGQLGCDQGARKIEPQAYGGYSEESIFRATPILIRLRRVGQIGHLWMSTISLLCLNTNRGQ